MCVRKCVGNHVGLCQWCVMCVWGGGGYVVCVDYVGRVDVGDCVWW